MMEKKNIGVVSIGTRGDFQPFIAFALALQERLPESQVYLISNSIYDQVAAQIIHGRKSKLLFRGLSGNPRETLDHPETKKALKTGDLSKLELNKPTEDLIKKCMVDLIDLSVNQIKFDWFISAPMTFPVVWMLSEKFEIPIDCIALVPDAPTEDFPFCVVSASSLGAEQNLATYEMIYSVGFQMMQHLFNEQRELLGLPKMTQSWNSMREKLNMPLLFACSKHCFDNQKPSKYRDNVELTGYLELKSEGESLSQELEEFLQVGQAPIFLSFGSMPALDPFQLFELAHDVLVKHDSKRVVLSCGWTNIDSIFTDLKEHKYEQEQSTTFSEEESTKYESILSNMRDLITEKRLLIIKEAPYYLLFPNCAAIAHHCGAGTTGAAVVAGTPHLPIPIFLDQPFWGQRMFDLGVGSSPILFKDLTSDKLNEAVSYVLDGEKSESIRNKALEIKELIERDEADPCEINVNICLKNYCNHPFIVPKQELE
ncbi:predicted protein [Naegleria gruberi]|uniref:Predicted protein n=1 Tax=Naegleria gruberi TaxID=5762 RepID=D2VR15_NAEGR|nr:uncharacterized protein NAEGRDRAFT_51572 [Naegleria gruberi]EFC40731.1 predicted protein [Naegleria gruberi]|eukprot:XP_002673475.1 predicted protein [Naegleria gruberi strain NEG-M]